MADLASLCEAACHVIRVLCPLEICQMARNARRSRDAVVIVDVAVRAHPRWIRVQSRERETRCRVIELAIRPQHSVMAVFARCREARMRNRRRRAVKGRLVA